MQQHVEADVRTSTAVEVASGVPDFLKRDYELRVRYLTDHYGRMWTRFNFFMVAMTALTIAVFKVVIDSKSLNASLPLLTASALLAGCWYVFGAQDRYLVEAYRADIERIARCLDAALSLSAELDRLDPEQQTGYTAIHDITYACVKRNIYQWRVPIFSTTTPVAWFPLLLLLVWTALIVMAAPCWA